MQGRLAASLIALVAMAAHASANEIDPAVSDIGLGSVQSSVARLIGKPQTTKAVEDMCVDGKVVELGFQGLRIEVAGDGTAKDSTVISIEVTSPSWPLSSGLRIGSSSKETKAAFGKPWSTELRNGHAVFFYVTKGNTGWARFYFLNDKMTKAYWGYTRC